MTLIYEDYEEFTAAIDALERLGFLYSITRSTTIKSFGFAPCEIATWTVEVEISTQEAAGSEREASK